MWAVFSGDLTPAPVSQVTTDSPLAVESFLQLHLFSASETLMERKSQAFGTVRRFDASCQVAAQK